MNIMIIIPSLSGGGAERVAITLASELRKKHHVNIVTYFEAKENYAYPDNIHVDCLNKGLASNPLQKITHTISRIIGLKKLKRRYKTDCAISFLPTPNFENVLSRIHETVIISIRAKCSVSTRGIEKWMNTFSGNHADKVVTLSKNVMYDEEEFFGVHTDRLITIYNLCDIETIHKKGTEDIRDAVFDEIRKSTDFLVITAGRVVEQKGQWYLIRAFSEVVKRNPRAQLVILGEGPLLDYQRELIKGLGIENNVIMHGFHSNIYPYLSRADVFCFSSLHEGFGNVLLEAMACNLPIVSTDCDAGPRELLAPNTDSRIFTEGIEYAEYGVLTPAHDWKRYSATDPMTKSERLQAEVLIKLMEDQELRKHYKKKSMERILDFTKEAITEEWEKIIM